MKQKCDFSGYATKNGLKCSDGRTIIKDAFKDNHGHTVPLVWQHLHNSPDNVLGHAVLENREDGVYAFGYFNDTEQGKNAKQLVEHKDIQALSIFANGLKQRGQEVIHGAIREVSLVLSGANPGALIDFLSLAHGDDMIESDDEAIIYTGLSLEHSSEVTEIAQAATATAESEETIGDIFNTMSEKQKNVVYAMLAEVMPDDTEEPTDEKSAAQSDDKGETFMKQNVFDKTDKKEDGQKTLTHDQLQEIVADAQKCGSFKEAFLAHAVTYGIENIDYLFPDARTLRDSPDFVSRRMEWVSGVINGASKSPFSRIKSMSADITVADARAKGYVKAALKKEEFFALSKRTTTPTTIYKKQKLDREDIIDITDLDVVAWLKAEMRVMLDEEIARAVLIGDGREPEDDDKINETNIRPIAKDADFYAHKVQVAASTTGSALIEEILRQRTNYKGSGNPTFFTTESVLVDLLLLKDKMGRRLYNTEQELASAIRVSSIVPVEVMESYTVSGEALLGIMVSMRDYTIGADRGGAIAMFDDFDIDYNQYKYLIETRCSGCLTKPKSALVFWRATGTKAVPTQPTFVQGTNTITFPTITGVVYKVNDVTKTGTLQISEDTWVDAIPDTGYYFDPNIVVDWEYPYVAT
jgi:hypothetical protein